MLFQKKIDRVLNTEEIEERHKKETENEPLEKGDLPAIFIAALMVFIPIVILLAGVAFGIMWLLTRT